jgi:uncharacterized linocin/CFP29 family protein
MSGTIEFVTSGSLGPLAYVPPGTDPVAFLRSSAPLPKNADELIDQAVTEVNVEKLVFVDDITNNRGLKTPVPDWLGIMKVTTQKRSKGGNVTMTMDPTPNARGEDFRVDLGEDSLPLFCIKQEFTIQPRMMMAWERYGIPLDTTMVSDSVRAVNEAIEVIGIEGTPISFNGIPVPGLVDSGSKVPFADATAWDNAGKTGAEINTDIDVFIEEMQANNEDPPYLLYVPRLYGNKLNTDYTTTYPKTIRQRLLERDDILDIVTVPRMTANTVALISPNKSNVDFLVGQSPTVVWWTEGPERYGIRRYMTIACVVPRFRETYTGQSGVVIGVPAL